MFQLDYLPRSANDTKTLEGQWLVEHRKLESDSTERPASKIDFRLAGEHCETGS